MGSPWVLLRHARQISNGQPAIGATANVTREEGNVESFTLRGSTWLRYSASSYDGEQGQYGIVSSGRLELPAFPTIDRLQGDIEQSGSGLLAQSGFFSHGYQSVCQLSYSIPGWSSLRV